MKKYNKEKRDELMWALTLQDYSLADIGEIFTLNRSTVLRIKRQMPKDWQPKWVKK